MDTKRIAKNTLFLYFRQMLIMGVGLYTVRVVLNVLGAEDYGIYNVVAGTVTMLGFLSGAMATASQRYFSFDLGRGDTEHLRTTFSVTLQIYALLALIVLLLAETAGLRFINHRLVIPSGRMAAANCIYQAAVVSFILTLLNAPYMASVIAHEDMGVYAYASIVETAMKLAVVFLLRVLPFDRLSVYGILLAAVAFLNTSVYRLWCRKKYEECHLRLIKDMELMREIAGYSGWNLFGAGVGVTKNQIMNILLNMRFGTMVNAARGIAAQVNSAVVSFSGNFTTALRPQIIKSYATDDKNASFHLVFRGCKYTFFLMYIFTLPLVLEMGGVLSIWLKDVPEWTVIFTQLTLIDALIDSIGYPIQTLAQATGKIRFYQGVVGGILLLNLPVSYMFLRFGFPAYFVMVVSIGITAIDMLVRILIVRIIARFPILQFFKESVIPCAIVTIVSAVVPGLLHWRFAEGTARIFITIPSSVFMTAASVWIFGMTSEERNSYLAFLKRYWRSGK